MEIDKLLSEIGTGIKNKSFSLDIDISKCIVSRVLSSNNNLESSIQFNSKEFFRQVFIPVVLGVVMLLFFVRFSSKNYIYFPVKLEVFEVKAREVEVMGDFTNWKPVKLKNKNGLWKAKFYLKPGIYRYVYIIDQSSYFLEPKREVAEDEFGTKSSLLVI